jgi:esterase/lipase superfamily enzyme
MNYTDPSLPRELFGWWSPALGLDMPIVRYGNRGRPLLLFPTAQADFLENERFWLVKAIEPHLFAGRVQVFSIDSINRFAWMNEQVPIPEKARRQALYSRYVEEEVVPHIRRCVGDPSARTLTSGASFGAFHAANFALRRPDLFPLAISMSGVYDVSVVGGAWDRGDAVYFNNPMDYVSHLHGDHLEWLRSRASLLLVCGQGQWEDTTGALESTRRFAWLLGEKGIRHELDLWGHDVPHDWPSWQRQLAHHLPRFC